MIVAVAADLSLPPQQSEILGHRASSQTVCRFKPRRSFLIFLYDELSGMGVFNHEGKRVICFCLPLGPTRAVFNWYASEGLRGGSLPEMNSSKEGPVLSLSEKMVLIGRTCGVEVGTSSVAVANVLLVEIWVWLWWVSGRKTLSGEVQVLPWRQRNRGAATAMLVEVIVVVVEDGEASAGYE